MDILRAANTPVFCPNFQTSTLYKVVPDAAAAAVSYLLEQPDGNIVNPGAGTIRTPFPAVGYTEVSFPTNELQLRGLYTVVILDVGGNPISIGDFFCDGYAPVLGGFFMDNTLTAQVCGVGTPAPGITVINVTAAMAVNLGPYAVAGFDTQGQLLAWNTGNIVTALTGSGLDAAGTRAALGMASANLDTQLTTLNGNVSSRAAPGAAMTLTSGERDAVAAAILDLANGVEVGLTLRQAQRLAAAVLGGIVTLGAGTASFKGAGIGGVRVLVSNPGDGSRPAVTLTL